MKFKVDENLPIEVAVALSEAGHDAMSVVDQGLGGRADASVAEVCRREERSLITLDVDFANVQAYPPPDYPGLVVLRLQRQDKAHVLAVVATVVPLLGEEPLEHTGAPLMDRGREPGPHSGVNRRCSRQQPRAI
jgi:predicted nuclease of predicted toxin-antitoxin system